MLPFIHLSSGLNGSTFVFNRFLSTLYQLYCSFTGIIIAATIYTSNPTPKILNITHNKRTTVGSMLMYSAIPWHTPQIILFVDERYNFFGSIKAPLSIINYNISNVRINIKGINYYGTGYMFWYQVPISDLYILLLYMGFCSYNLL